MGHYYHYTSLRNYQSMTGTHQNYSTDGLLPLRRFLALSLAERFEISAKASEGISTGFLEATPKPWIKRFVKEGKSLFEDLLSYRLSNAPIAQLQVVVNKDDDIYVADYSANLMPQKPEQGVFDYMKETKSSYWSSLVPYFDYVENPRYLLPEVVCFTRLPPERLHLTRVFEDSRQLFNELRTISNRPLIPKPPEMDMSFCLGDDMDLRF